MQEEIREETIERLKSMIRDAYMEGWHDGAYAQSDWRLQNGTQKEVEAKMEQCFLENWNDSSVNNLSQRI